MGEALGGTCALAGMGQAIYAGRVDPALALRDQPNFLNNAELIGGLVAALGSGGDVNATVIAAGIARSGFQNNYLTHAQRAEVDQLMSQIVGMCMGGNSDAIGNCDGTEALWARINALRAISQQQTLQMIATCSTGPSAACASMLNEARDFNAWADAAGTGSVASWLASGGDLIAPEGDWTGTYDLDKLSVEVLSRVQSGEISAEYGQILMIERLARYDGAIRVVAGVIEIGGVAVCAVASGGACLLGAASAVMGAGTAVSGGLQYGSGQMTRHPLEAALIGSGMEPDKARTIRNLVELGLVTASVVNGTLTLVNKAGTVVSQVDNVSADVLQKVGGSGAVGPGGGNANAIPVPAKLGKSIHSGAQDKHIVGTNNYDAAKGRSILTADPTELLNGVHSGKYPILRMAGDKPIVDFGKPIGRLCCINHVMDEVPLFAGRLIPRLQ